MKICGAFLPTVVNTLVVPKCFIRDIFYCFVAFYKLFVLLIFIAQAHKKYYKKIHGCSKIPEFNSGRRPAAPLFRESGHF